MGRTRRQHARRGERGPAKKETERSSKKPPFKRAAADHFGSSMTARGSLWINHGTDGKERRREKESPVGVGSLWIHAAGGPNKEIEDHNMAVVQARRCENRHLR